MRFGRVARVYLAANSGFARLRPTSMTTPKHLYFACLIVAAPVVDDPSCNALQPCATPGTPQMSLAGTGSLHDRQEDVLARNERGIFLRSVEVHDPPLTLPDVRLFEHPTRGCTTLLPKPPPSLFLWLLLRFFLGCRQ